MPDWESFASLTGSVSLTLAGLGWRDVAVGAFVTAILFALGKFAIGFYIGQSDPGSAYGAAGSLAVILVWITFERGRR